MDELCMSYFKFFGVSAYQQSTVFILNEDFFCVKLGIAENENAIHCAKQS